MPLVHLKVCDLEVFKNFLPDPSLRNNFSSTSLDLYSFLKADDINQFLGSMKEISVSSSITINQLANLLGRQ